MAKRQRRQPRRPIRMRDILRSDGALCVTFVNTGCGQRSALESYTDLLAWAVEAGALAAETATRLGREAGERPGVADKVWRKARTLHARLQRILGALAACDDPAAGDLTPFNAELRAAMAARELSPGGRRWVWGESDDDLDRMLWPVLHSAAHILTTGNRAKVGRCPGDCGLFFVGRGAGRPRKWCSRSCRDRSTTRAHYRSRIKPRNEQWKRQSETRQRAGLAGYESWQPPAATETNDGQSQEPDD